MSEELMSRVMIEPGFYNAATLKTWRQVYRALAASLAHHAHPHHIHSLHYSHSFTHLPFVEDSTTVKTWEGWEVTAYGAVD